MKLRKEERSRARLSRESGENKTSRGYGDSIVRIRPEIEGGGNGRMIKATKKRSSNLLSTAAGGFLTMSGLIKGSNKSKM